jgi:Arc/MetJ-type ribon-helix-helix transcriptional regulator
MTSAKVALSIPSEFLEQARREVATGRAKSLSAFVSDALDEKLRRDELAAILDEMDAKLGAPNKAAKVWAKRVLKQRR